MMTRNPEPGLELTYLRHGGESGGDPLDPYVGQDRFNRISDIRWMRTGAAGDYVDRIMYGFDAGGNRLWRRNLIAMANWDEHYAYDLRSQLLRRRRGTLNGTQAGLAGPAQEEEFFTYDATGNWERYQVTTPAGPALDQTRTHNAANEITDIPDTRGVSHDRAGNMTVAPTPGEWGINHWLIWDAWNRLVKVWTLRHLVVPGQPAADLVATYAYDGLTRRVWKEAASLEPVRRHYYYSEQWQVLEERLGASARAERQFVWGQRYLDDLILRETFAPTEDTEGSSSSSTEDPPPPVPARLYATHDQWHVIGAVAADGTVVERFSYRAFGETQFHGAEFQPVTASLTGWETCYGAYRRDVETGLHTVRYRYLHAALGRWVSRDPLVNDLEAASPSRLFSFHRQLLRGIEPGELPSYNYIGNRIGYGVDPDGLAIKHGLIIAGILGAGTVWALCCVIRIKQIAESTNMSVDAATASWPPEYYAGGAEGSPADALQHCILGCNVTQSPGACLSSSFLQDRVLAHEDANTFDGRADINNNRAGFSVAGDCVAGCIAALQSGKLSCFDANGVHPCPPTPR